MEEDFCVSLDGCFTVCSVRVWECLSARETLSKKKKPVIVVDVLSMIISVGLLAKDDLTRVEAKAAWFRLF